jgi:4-hydroxy-3-polyprenylbenzoate decarboxylase
VSASWILGVSGASGALFARRFLHLLSEMDEVERVHLVVSRAARKMIREETDLDLEERGPFPLGGFLGAEPPAGKIEIHEPEAIEAPISSGSFPVAGMVVLPCSMGTVAAVAQGAGRNLIHRAAEVQMKERRPLLLCFRESPLSVIHLENLLRVARAGAVPVPLMPPWYLRPRNLEEMADGYCARVLQTMGLEHPGGSTFRYKA